MTFSETLKYQYQNAEFLMIFLDLMNFQFSEFLNHLKMGGARGINYSTERIFHASTEVISINERKKTRLYRGKLD